MFDENVTEGTPMNPIDEAGERVLAFQLRVQNLGRIGDLTSNLEQIATSGDWRSYSTALGPEQWLDAEFDYFLIASGINLEDARRVIQWAKVGSQLAAMMDPAAGADRRRPIEEAASSWKSAGAGASFVQRARELGWVGSNEAVRVAVSKRALEQARSGVTNEEHARKSRTERLTTARVTEIDRIVDEVIVELTSADERRYFIDRLRASIRGEQRRPANPRTDAERLGWNVTALAQYWGVSRMTAHRWVEEIRPPGA
jgi:hypothetical protein